MICLVIQPDLGNHCPSRLVATTNLRHFILSTSTHPHIHSTPLAEPQARGNDDGHAAVSALFSRILTDSHEIGFK